METNNTTPTIVDELLGYIDAQLEMTETLHSFALKIDPNQFGYSNDIRILNVLKQLVIERKTQTQTIEGDRTIEIERVTKWKAKSHIS